MSPRKSAGSSPGGPRYSPAAAPCGAFGWLLPPPRSGGRCGRLGDWPLSLCSFRSRVLLDPTSKVLADGELRVQAPSISAPQSETTRSAPKASTITNFTVFKTVRFEKGLVMTGWMFLTSTQKSPTHQYCYYTESSDTPGLNVILDLGDDQKMEEPTKAPSGFDIPTAFSKCVWFRGDA